MKEMTFEIQYLDNWPFVEKIKITTDRSAEWTMEQYQRNRKPFKWKLK